jgi:hypothetical protein
MTLASRIDEDRFEMVSSAAPHANLAFAKPFIRRTNEHNNHHFRRMQMISNVTNRRVVVDMNAHHGAGDAVKVRLVQIAVHDAFVAEPVSTRSFLTPRESIRHAVFGQQRFDIRST